MSFASFAVFRFVASEALRKDKEDRLRAFITTECVYFVKVIGQPTPENVIRRDAYSDLCDTQYLYNGRSSSFCPLRICQFLL